ncbi:MAG: hypothetical protein HDT20_06110 [Oscillibacter sp.]|nr:hypothetical protein [Oscillibacter sp.]MBD5169674.1 hypothetical protein [Oscillibacter sp.]
MIEWDVEDHPISKAGKKYTGKPVTEEKTYFQSGGTIYFLEFPLECVNEIEYNSSETSFSPAASRLLGNLPIRHPLPMNTKTNRKGI